MNNYKNNRFSYTLSFWESIIAPSIIILLGQIIGVIINLGLIKLGFLGLGIIASFGVSFGASVIMLFLYKKLPFSVWKNMVLSPHKSMYWIFSILLYLSILPLTEYATTLVPTEGNKLLEDLYKIFIDSFEMIFNYPIAAFITVCILAPILEETIFRGFILQGLLNNKMNPWLAILMTACMFGIAHMNPWQFIGAGILGACFGFIYWRTGSLLICMFLHFLNNSISYMVSMQTKDLEVTFFEVDYLLIFGSIILSAFFVYLIYKKTIHAPIRNTEQ